MTEGMGIEAVKEALLEGRTGGEAAIFFCNKIVPNYAARWL
jgi:hypothetical protein